MNALDKMQIGFIGAGKAGVSLGAYFRSKGLGVGGYISRSRASAQSAADITASKAYADMAGLAAQCGIIFITTPDDRIEEVWYELMRCDIRGGIICHTSGSVTSGVFAGIDECGAYGYSIHPMYAFAGRDGNIDGLDAACFTIEGDGRRLDDLKSIFSRMGNKTIIINREGKALYHLANVTASNLVLALISIGCEFLEEAGAGGDESLSALMPLIRGNIDNIAGKGLIDSLTGPAERNDTGTVQKHLSVLPAGYERIYKVLTGRLVELSAKKHPGRDYSKLLALLGQNGD